MWVANADNIYFTELPRKIGSPIVHIYSSLFFNSTSFILICNGTMISVL